MEYIVLIPNSIKKNIIKEVRNKYYNYNIKFLSLEEFIENIKIVIKNKNQNNKIISNAYNDIINKYNVEIMIDKYKETYLK